MKSQKTRSRPGCFKVVMFIGLLMLICVAFWACMNFVGGGVDSGEPVVRVSPEITILTGPLDANGDIDYLEAVNEILAEGVTAENNSIVLILQATGPSPEGKLSKEFFKRLGMDPLSENGNYHLTPIDWTEQNPDIVDAYDIDDVAMIDDHRGFANQNPWSADDFPLLDRWIDEMQEPLDIVVEASNRPRYYHPLVAGDAKHSRVINSLLSVVQYHREFARSLSARAMRNLHAGEIEKCNVDIMAIYRLGHLISQGNTLVEQLIAVAILGYGNTCANAVAASELATADQLLNLRDEIHSLPELDSLAKCIQNMERFLMPDLLISMARGDTGILGVGQQLSTGSATNEEISGFAKTIHRSVDWEEAFVVTNLWYDDLLKIAEIEDRGQRHEALKDFEVRMKQLETNTRSGVNLTMALLSGRRAKGRLVGDVMIGMLMPATTAVDEAIGRNANDRIMTELVLALAAFKSDNGEFPKSLDELVPKYLKAVPVDGYCGLPLVYKPNDPADAIEPSPGDIADGSASPESFDAALFSLYSLGWDGVDDGSGIQAPFGVTKWEDFEKE